MARRRARGTGAPAARARGGGRATEPPGAEGLKSLRKAIRVLECFSIQEPRLSLSEIARRVGLPASTTHPILATLRGAGFVEQDGERDHYRLSQGRTSTAAPTRLPRRPARRSVRSA